MSGGGLTSSIDSLPSQGHGPMGGHIGMGMGMGMERSLGGPMGSNSSMLGLERIASVSSTSSGNSAQRSGGSALGGFSSSTGELPGATPAPSGPFLTPGSYGTGLPASRGTRGVPGGITGGIPPGAGGVPPQGGPYGGGGGYGGGPGYAMGVPEGPGYGVPGGVPPGGVYGPGVGASQGPPSRMYGSMAPPSGAEVRASGIPLVLCVARHSFVVL